MYKDISVKTLRRRLGKKQDEFAFEFGINRSTYATWELKNNFPRDILQQIYSKYKAEFDNIDSSLIEENAAPFYTNSVESLRKRITELEDLIRQKDSIINNQAQVIEMQNQTYLALKQSIKKQ